MLKDIVDFSIKLIAAESELPGAAINSPIFTKPR